MLKTIMSNFRHPRGLIGRIAGWIMAMEDQERIDWVISRLDVRPKDRILEIGFGPGVGIQRMAAKTKEGFVAGIDPSHVMIGQASQRNAAAIKTGRVKLQLASVEHLPYAPQQFDKVLTINTLHVWTDVQSGLAETYRVLKPGGMIVIVEQPPSKVTREAEIRDRGEEVRRSLFNAGFANVQMNIASLSRGMSVLVHGKK